MSAFSRAPCRSYLLVLWAIFIYVLLSNAWVVDDAYITFRSVWNWHNGFGLRWNVIERVQVYTHPLWMLLISLCFAITHEFFFTTLVVSGILCVATIALILRSFPPDARWKITPALALLVASKAFVDYTSSGLENPLSYLLIVLFYGTYIFGYRPLGATQRDLRSDAVYYSLIVSLAFVNRMDTVLLFIPGLGHYLFNAGRTLKTRLVGPLLLGALPAMLWLAIALIYYGFPFPNTYYAKSASIGISTVDLMRQGIAYFINGLAWDPITLGTIAVVVVLVTREGTTRMRMGVAGVALYLLYIVRIGASGTHMSGRFFAVPFLLAVLLLMALPISRRSGAAVTALAIALIFFCPMSPLKANTGYYVSGGDGSGWGRNGIIDTRYLVQHHDGSSIFNFERKRDMPNMVWFDEGLEFRRSSERVRIGGHGPAIGFFGFAAGPHKTLIDTFGLGDALLARLPTRSANWYGGHFERKMPDGYEESVRTGTNRIVDPDLHAYFEKLKLVTQGPVWSAARFRAIWELNVGSADGLLRAYCSRH